MATKKYISLDKLSLYDSKIKAYLASADATTLASAKSYADEAATGAFNSAKSYTDTEVAKANAAAAAAQSDVDNLETYVGTIPSSYTEENIVAYINKKAEETLSSAQGGSSETAASVLAALNSYKAENDPKVTANASAAAAAQSSADKVAADLATETTNRTNADTALGNRITTLEGQITGLSGAMHFIGVKESVPTDLSGYNAGDVITVGDKEYVFNGTAFVEFGDVSAEGTRLTQLESDVDQLEKDLAANLTAAKSYADSSANGAFQSAKSYADGLNSSMDTRVTALEGDSHTHSNKTVLDGITSTKVSAWDSAATNSHTHSNKTVLDGITAAKVSAWDAAESNAKSYADEEASEAELQAKHYADDLNTAMDTRVTAVETWQTEMIEASEAEITALFA